MPANETSAWLERPRSGCRALLPLEYGKVNEAGSHIILQTQEPTPHRVAVFTHKALRVGTLNEILRDVANHKGADRQAILCKDAVGANFSHFYDGGDTLATLGIRLKAFGQIVPRIR